MNGSASPVAVVTGASRGLGRALARQFGRRGFDLVICARAPEGLADAAAELAATGAEVLGVPADLTVRAEIERLVEASVERFGRIDVWVNNAGVIQVGPATTMAAEQFALALDTMLWPAVHSTLAVLPVMRAQGHGRIVTISSVGGRIPAPHLLPYTTAKFAATGFSEGLRTELRKHGITVTTVVPGLMRTGSPRNALFTGAAGAEFRWFALADSLPLLSMDADRAATKIVSATLRGRADLVLTPAAKLGTAVHGLAPGLVARMAGMVERLLPQDDGHQGDPVPGHSTGRQPGWFEAVTALTRRAARRLGQHADPS